MHWAYLVVAVALFALAVKASLPGWLVFMALLGALAMLAMWMLGWLAARISSGARNEAQILSPEELRRLREQAQARKAAAQDKTDEPS